MSRRSPGVAALVGLGRRDAALVAGASLAAGFAVAQGTGVRTLGGAVLVAGLVLCVPSWIRRSGVAVAGSLVLMFALLFAVSHVLALGLGLPAWLSVGAVSVVQGAASYALDRGRRAPVTKDDRPVGAARD